MGGIREDQQKVRTGNQPAAFAALRNLVTGAWPHPRTPAYAQIQERVCEISELKARF